jgi:holo-[acyl-carrier protein] synthase
MIRGIGIDLVELERLRGVLDRHGSRFLDRVLTADEREYCDRHRDPVPQIAARFAAKEAALKAIGTGIAAGIGWKDVEVTRSEEGAPSLRLSGAAARIAAEMEVGVIHVSLTHDRHSAAAVVVLEGPS